MEISGNDFAGNVTYATAAAETADTGSLTTSSGIDGLKDYFDDVVADRTSTTFVQVSLDQVVVSNTETQREDAPAAFDIIKLDTATSVTTGKYSEQAEVRAYTLTQDGTKNINIKVGDDYVFVTDAGSQSNKVLPANMALAAQELASSAAVARASALGLGLSTQTDANIKSMTVSFYGTNDTTTYESTHPNAATASATAMSSVTDEVELSIGGQTVTATADGATHGIADALVTAWNAKYNTASTLYTVESGSDSSIVVTVSSTTGNRAEDDLISISASVASAVTGQPAPILAWSIGQTSGFAANKDTDDNMFKGSHIILLLSNTSGLAAFPAATLTTTNAIVSSTLTSTLDYSDPSTYDIGMTGSTNLANGDVFPNEARTIVNPYSEAIDGTTEVSGTTYTTDRTNFL